MALPHLHMDAPRPLSSEAHSPPRLDAPKGSGHPSRARRLNQTINQVLNEPRHLSARTKKTITALLPLLIAITIAVIALEIAYMRPRSSKSFTVTRFVAATTSVEGMMSTIKAASSDDQDEMSMRDLGATGAKTAFACGSNCTVKKTSDGSNWKDVLRGGNCTLSDISVTKDGGVWSIGSRTVITSSNGGKTWDQVRIGDAASEGAYPEVEAIDKKNVWIMWRDGRVVRTEDGGRSWTIYTLDPKSAEQSEEAPDEEEKESRARLTELVTFKPCSTGVCWAAIELNETDIFIYRTMDGGKSWELTSPQSFSRVRRIEAVGPDQAFIMGRKSGTPVSDQGQPGAAADRSPPIETSTTYSQTALMATFDGGKTWSEPWLDEVSDIDLVDENTLWAVVPGNPQSRVVLASDAGRRWKASLVDIPAGNSRNMGSEMTTPTVSGVSRSCAWVFGGGSIWWAAATTTDAGSNWTYYEE